MKNTFIKKALLLISILAFAVNMNAQRELTVMGKITDENKEPLTGAIIVVKNQPGLGTSADVDGNYKIKAGTNDVLVFSFMGFETQEIAISGKSEINVVLKESTTTLEEVTVVGSGVQRKVSVVGAITSVETPLLKNSASASLSNSLAGNVAGIIAQQLSGEPGQSYSEFWIRGISTFGANASALVLVDGIERNFNEVNVEDIESFSVLKDASATAIYGNRGANGVVIITTKKGTAGKVNINAKLEYGITTPSRLPKYVDATTYANMANEARLSRGEEPKYTRSEIAIIGYGLDKDLYPNMDWQDELLNSTTTSSRAMLNISGGGTTARYYISGAYYNEDGLYKAAKMKNYDTNSNYKRYNFRSNIDVNITSSTVIELGVSGWIATQNSPGNESSGEIYNSFATLTPVTVPKLYSNGLFPTYGAGNQTNPYVLLNEKGYKQTWNNKIETNLALRQDLSFLTKGLNFYARFSYDAYNENHVSRLKSPTLYRATQRDAKGNLVLTKIQDESPLTQSTSSWGDRRYYGEMNLNYENTFGEDHRVGGLLLYYQQDYGRNDAGEDVFKAVPQRNVAFSGRTTYSYLDRYFFEFNFGYTGSENFEKGKRFGFFPAIAGGWLISNEPLIANNLKWLTKLKARYSYGQVGNDKLSGDTRFPYITIVNGTGGYSFGETGQTGMNGVQISTIGTPYLTWETAVKHNIGIDADFFNKLSFSVDFFKDTRRNIFKKREHIPGTTGLTDSQVPWANVGKMENKGFDGTMAFTDKIGKVSYTIRGNVTYTNTNVLEYDEPANELPYKMTQGYRLNQTRGLEALGLFKDENDIINSPTHTFGPVKPGDIKYKDVNGDGKIDDDDIVPIGYTTTPGLIYGMGLSLEWNGFDFNVLFQGAGNSDFFVGGSGVYPFADGEVGNILKVASNPYDRWISREISGTADTENPNAVFPRLTYGNSTNNNRASTFWLRNARYLRLKNLTFGYTIPQKISRKLLMDNARIYFLGNNLCVWDEFGWWDPEQASGNGAVYPIQKNFTIGLTVNF
ncbi:SusC/RagA family TonB-linked outer membrane protein [Dysgonomonas termitidis]|uniref:SusC/RagA family TonB-linked outer membrane protein n=1 Tax=Dysgonomonas termitidis TaxID=1516126 RepID=A0ABV9KU53_9BACT